MAQPMLDDDTVTNLEDVKARLQRSLNEVKAIATSGDEAIDRKIMEGEHAMRAALIAVNKKLGKY